MKVLHLGKFYPPARGGMETILALICERTSGEVQNRVLVANSSSGTVKERHGSVDVIRVGAVARIGAVSVCPTLPLALAREEADLIVLHEPNPMALVAYFLSRPRGRLVVWYHSDVIRPGWQYRTFYRPFLRFALSRAERVVVSSPTLGASAPDLAEWQSKCAVIPFGIDTRRMDGFSGTAARADEIRAKFSGPLVLFVGRLVKYKGVDVLLDAARGVDATVLIAGEGPERTALQRRALELGIANRVKFLGTVPEDELYALYRACDVFVLPSVTRQEAFGVVQLEAMAAGKPVVSTDLGTGVAWVNQDGETGLVVPPMDAAALQDALRRLLSDPALRQRLGEGAARRARSIFTIDRMIDGTLALYRELMGTEVVRKTVA